MTNTNIKNHIIKNHFFGNYNNFAFKVTNKSLLMYKNNTLIRRIKLTTDVITQLNTIFKENESELAYNVAINLILAVGNLVAKIDVEEAEKKSWK